jgi:AAA+ superfamily predicted ATPase
MIDCARGTLLGHHASQSMDEPTQAMIQFVGRYRRWLNSQLASSSQDSSRPAGDSLVVWETVPAELMMFCWPALVGFSFTAKAWGHVLVEGLSEIQFHDHAFDRLVISEERKQLLRALIRFGGAEKIAADGDIVGSKNGGTIILLHGPPGVGKTVTAEAIAEVLHRPLYYVTMGELGVNPGDLERRLADVLDLCAGWNALALLDEADVFLETRSTNDLVRNTLVCVMLRLLEYHPGILFLTTNRVRSFDPAVESRVTVALRYDSLSAGARGKIWQNLLASAPLPVAQDVSVEELSGHALNGRQIKNAVRLAVALARERQTNINRSVLNATIEITALGRQAMQADDSWKE